MWTDAAFVCLIQLLDWFQVQKQLRERMEAEARLAEEARQRELHRKAAAKVGFT